MGFGASVDYLVGLLFLAASCFCTIAATLTLRPHRCATWPLNAISILLPLLGVATSGPDSLFYNVIFTATSTVAAYLSFRFRATQVSIGLLVANALWYAHILIITLVWKK